MKHNLNLRRGFSLIELVIVVVIIAIIAAIAIPKMSRGATGASEAALAQDLAQMRGAIDMFVSEHPGVTLSTTQAIFINQLTTYTDATGAAAATKDATHIYGPYLKSIPPLPIGTNKGAITVTATGPAGTGSFGWFYDAPNNTIWANDPSSDQDIKGVSYNAY